jgi:small subunit ribosomal protein S16
MEAKQMSVKIKLRREGGKKKPSYKVVVIDSRKPRDGRFIEQLGYYQPIPDPYIFKVDKEASLKWIEKGAQLSETVKNLFKKEGISKK